MPGRPQPGWRAGRSEAATRQVRDEKRGRKHVATRQVPGKPASWQVRARKCDPNELARGRTEVARRQARGRLAGAMGQQVGGGTGKQARSDATLRPSMQLATRLQ